MTPAKIRRRRRAPKPRPSGPSGLAVGLILAAVVALGLGAYFVMGSGGATSTSTRAGRVEERAGRWAIEELDRISRETGGRVDDTMRALVLKAELGRSENYERLAELALANATRDRDDTWTRAVPRAWVRLRFLAGADPLEKNTLEFVLSSEREVEINRDANRRALKR